MEYGRGNQISPQNLSGLAAVALLHAALIYGLLNGLATTITSRPPPPMIGRIIREPPPPPAPPAIPAPNITPPALALPSVEAPAITPQPPAPPRPPTQSSMPGQPAPPPRATALPDTKFSPSAMLGGAPAPAYPDAYQSAAHPGHVIVDCTIETTGTPTNCRVLGATGGEAFAIATLRWLTGPSHPVYRPALKSGVAQREQHQWTIDFEPAAEDSR